MQILVRLFFMVFAIQVNFRIANAYGFISTASDVPQRFTSPGFPRSYPNNVDCWWNFTTTPGYRILVEFRSFVTEGCCDRLEVIVEGTDVTTLAGNLIIGESLVSSTNWISFHFYSDSQVTHEGFEALFRRTTKATFLGVTCGSSNYVASEAEQTLFSPGWPNHYDDNLYCVWNITARPGFRIRLNFTSFYTEFCCDYITISEDNNLSNPLLRIRGNVTMINPIISHGNQIAVEFFSDEADGYRGFYAYFTETTEASQIQAPCGFSANATSTVQYLYSPGYPGPYENNLNCTWHLSTNDDSMIELSLGLMDVEERYDLLTVYDGGQGNGVRLGVGQDPILSFVSTTDNLRLRFESDGDNSKLGFWLTYKKTQLMPATTTPPSTSRTPSGGGERVCGFGAMATSLPLPINSPRWPDLYPLSIDCEWTIVARSGFRIRLDFASFITEKDFDYLSIREEGRELLRLDGNLTIPSPLISRTNRLVLLFHSDESGLAHGFRATFLETRASPVLPFAPCGFQASATKRNQSLNSPGWPRSYDDHLNCVWNLTAKQGFRIQVFILLIDTEACCDYLKGLAGGQEVFRLRGNSTSLRNFISPSNHLMLRFHSDLSVSGRGFQLKFIETAAHSLGYVAPCGSVETATAAAQMLNSPSWPAAYGNNLDCIWNITATVGQTIKLEILNFNTELCCDYLDIFDGNSHRLRLAGDVSIHGPVLSTTSKLSLRFHSDATVTGHGFQIVFQGSCASQISK